MSQFSPIKSEFKFNMANLVCSSLNSPQAQLLMSLLVLLVLIVTANSALTPPPWD
jgi:hypothetical protein